MLSIQAAVIPLTLWFCCSHWQQDVEEADTSAICNTTVPSPRSARPPAAREFPLLSHQPHTSRVENSQVTGSAAEHVRLILYTTNVLLNTYSL